MYPLGESARGDHKDKNGRCTQLESTINILKWSKCTHQEKEGGYYWSWKMVENMHTSQINYFATCPSLSPPIPG